MSTQETTFTEPQLAQFRYSPSNLNVDEAKLLHRFILSQTTVLEIIGEDPCFCYEWQLVYEERVVSHSDSGYFNPAVAIHAGMEDYYAHESDFFVPGRLLTERRVVQRPAKTDK